MRNPGLRTLRIFALLLFGALFAAIVLRWISLERWHGAYTQTPPEPTPVIIEPERETKPARSATPARSPVIGGRLETAKLFNGITFHSSVEPVPGGAASDERNDPQSYLLELKLRTKVPTPNKTIAELAKVNPDLPRLLPALDEMVKPESVSPLFTSLYDTKLRVLRENLGRLDQLLSRHNFFDCQTILQLRHPQTHRRAVLLQADMDVDADGSDSDRLPGTTPGSATFKPFTSFKWQKKTAAPNPYLPAYEERLKKYENELGAKGTNAERKRELKGAIAQIRDETETLKHWSFLIGATDPYIVLPGPFPRGDAGKVGDYAVVVFGDKIFPAVVGDIGPADKVGEASLRIAREINSLATPNNRPVDDLKVSYLIFPGTAEPPFGPPDLEKLQARCEALVKEIGGASVPLHHWENIIPPPPTPTPSPTLTPTPTATASSSPAATSSPGTSPSPTFAFPTATPSAGTSP